MALSDSPSLQDYQNGLPQQPPDTMRRKRLTQGLIVLLGLLVIALGSYNVLASRDIALLRGRGDLRGQVVDENGNGLQAVVFVFGVDEPVETAADGAFFYPDVPAGEQVLIVAHNGFAADYTVTVQAGQENDVGQIVYTVVTPEPPEE